MEDIKSPNLDQGRCCYMSPSGPLLQSRIHLLVFDGALM